GDHVPGARTTFVEDYETAEDGEQGLRAVIDASPGRPESRVDEETSDPLEITCVEAFGVGVDESGDRLLAGGHPPASLARGPAPRNRRLGVSRRCERVGEASRVSAGTASRRRGSRPELPRRERRRPSCSRAT